MKNTIKNSKKGILMVTLFATLLSFANEAKLINIKNEAKKTSLTLNNVKQGNLLSVKDAFGITLYKEIIQETGSYTKGFDLTVLPNGDYLFELNKDLEIKTIPFTVKSSIVSFNKDKETTVFKPTVRVEGDLVFVSKLTLEGNPLNIKVYYTEKGSNNSDLIFSEDIENTKIIERTFKLENQELGSFKIVILSEGNEFIKYINS
ncbi:hypothetical protein FPF71_00410 [Algibacter amylolyticus]|uniref:Uncharacterized protein n=1 Tax=Algibacter amylolyticus TaxID=1608400 RepID=A0A5M7BCS4_9FLAO|nr:hypothetical protein [Algibacter amylolyticus]KAA5827342.1 hypothetical protein F2B50_00410 [Algibacter amylolyticus]MBB5266528.1 hypothetical protein [Algibacter amylolyticus]TSJ81587.1 hypothetical protein FPF71_00410 [Algibacter amylolyticus]